MKNCTKNFPNLKCSVFVFLLLSVFSLPSIANAASTVEKVKLHIRDRTAVMSASSSGDGTEGRCISANIFISMFEHASTVENDPNPGAAAFVDIYYFDLCRGQLTGVLWNSQNHPGLTNLRFTARSAHLGATIDTPVGPANLEVSWNCDGLFSRNVTRTFISNPPNLIFRERIRSQTCAAKVTATLTLGNGETLNLSDPTLDLLLGELRKETTGQVTITRGQ